MSHHLDTKYAERDIMSIISYTVSRRSDRDGAGEGYTDKKDWRTGRTRPVRIKRLSGLCHPVDLPPGDEDTSTPITARAPQSPHPPTVTLGLEPRALHFVGRYGVGCGTAAFVGAPIVADVAAARKLSDV